MFNRACEDAFSHLVLAVVQPGERLAAVTVATDTQGEHEEQITCPKVNILPEGVYEYTREHEQMIDNPTQTKQGEERKTI